MLRKKKNYEKFLDLPIYHCKLQRRSKHEKRWEESVKSKSLAGPVINDFLNNSPH